MVVQIGAVRWESMCPFSPVHSLSIFFPGAGQRLGVRHLLNAAPRPKANEITGPSAGGRGAVRDAIPTELARIFASEGVRPSFTLERWPWPNKEASACVEGRFFSTWYIYINTKVKWGKMDNSFLWQRQKY